MLNLYAGIGGNRKLWKDVDVTAVEINSDIAKIYQEFFPDDEVIVTDAHKYLLENYDEYDFIWSSPPCPSHSRARYWGSFGENRTKIYPDMKLYQEIIFLKHYYKSKWVVENVKGYYEPLIKPQEISRHYFWSNFKINKKPFDTDFFPKDSLPTLEKIHRVDLSNLNVNINKRVALRNCVNPELGKHIFNCAFKLVQKPLNCR